MTIVALFLLFSVFVGNAIYHSYQASQYVKELRSQGIKCDRHQENSGPTHSRMTYWICDNGETIHGRWFKIQRTTK